MSMLIVSPHNNDEGLKKNPKKREDRRQLLKLRAIILYKNKCIPMGILLK